MTLGSTRSQDSRPAPRARRPGLGWSAGAGVTAAIMSMASVAGCQGNSPSPRRDPTAAVVPSAPAAFTPTVGPSVVRTREVRGFSRLLTDHRGMTVYTNSGPVNSKMPACTGSCTSVWHPVIVDARELTGPGSLGVRLTVLERPDGLHQLAVNGHRAYTFVADTGPGQVGGDTFITGGPHNQTYTWRAARVADAAPTEVVFTPR